MAIRDYQNIITPHFRTTKNCVAQLCRHDVERTKAYCNRTEKSILIQLIRPKQLALGSLLGRSWTLWLRAKLKLLANKAALILILALQPTATWAWKLSPSGTEQEKKISSYTSSVWERAVATLAGSGIEHFTQPVHEEITQKIYGCQGDQDACGNGDMLWASAYVVAGVRWNDDPPFMLSEGEGKQTACKTTETIRVATQPRCWSQLFHDAERRVQSGAVLNTDSKASLLARSHFGDLQFLHAMAEHDGEIAYETKQRIMMWAEFTWRTSLGEYKLDTNLREVPITGMVQFFGRSEWRVQDLFTLGNVPLRRYINEVAFGSLLHTIEDSFAKGHVQREEGTPGASCPGVVNMPVPGRVIEFHSYTHQDSGRHGRYDEEDAFKAHMLGEKPNVVDVGAEILKLNDAKTPWEQVRPYMECIFTLADPQRPASAGADFASD